MNMPTKKELEAALQGCIDLLEDIHAILTVYDGIVLLNFDNNIDSLAILFVFES